MCLAVLKYLYVHELGGNGVNYRGCVVIVGLKLLFKTASHQETIYQRLS